MSSTYHTEEKTFIEANCISTMYTGEKSFCSCYFWRFVSPFNLEIVKNCSIFCMSLFYIFREEKSRYKKQIYFSTCIYLVWCVKVHICLGKQHGLQFCSSFKQAIMYSGLIFVSKIKPENLLEVQAFNTNWFFTKRTFFGGSV